jgi:hypothetical protein
MAIQFLGQKTPEKTRIRSRIFDADGVVVASYSILSSRVFVSSIHHHKSRATGSDDGQQFCLQDECDQPIGAEIEAVIFVLIDSLVGKVSSNPARPT